MRQSSFIVFSLLLGWYPEILVICTSNKQVGSIPPGGIL